ncbi:Os12g0455902 [Oryza sativa Japonica Group]|uniref:Os12g0455902 protein n=1 Tax=Oryza sativa subsp. japonica TaxID=39947 RepID=A0A0P0Y9T9_ORYSJ|nr:Os12g0455902 [Oryza sativa Japonica Group]
MIKHPWLIASTQFWQASGEQPPSHCGAHAVATVSVYSHEWAHVSSQLPAEHLRRRRRDGGGGEDNQHDAGHGGDGDGSRRRSRLRRWPSCVDYCACVCLVCLQLQDG